MKAKGSTRITAAEMKFTGGTVKYTWVEYKEI
jgi:hypothetical protein